METREELEATFRQHVLDLERRAMASIESLGFDRLLILAGPAKAKSAHDDQDYTFVATPAYAHFAPAPVPGAAVILGEGRRRLFLPHEESFWERPEPPDLDLLGSVYEIIPARLPSDAAGFVGPRTAVVSHDVAPFEVPALNMNPLSVREALDELRVKKSPYELEALRQASRRAALGHVAVKDAFLGGETSELALHLLYLSATQQDDADTPYKNIVAVNEHAAILHHVVYRRSKVDGARSVLLDAGATQAGYGSDITRTWAKSAGPFAELVARMAQLQDEVIARIEVGKMYEALHDEAHELLAGALIDTGLYRGSADSAVELGVTRAFLPHGLGHSLGISVHDVGCKKTQPRPENKYLRNTREIEAEQVFTIEPGLYFIDSLLGALRSEANGREVNWVLVDRLRSAGGIRIEDNIHVLERGVENLTRPHLANV
ncbi:MAG: Xaa-Pro dipeptidase [Deltaproteobacteria bacterium]|nr:Xaa-Pro dipeptidase [Deltaproteobacteria bacterium]